VPELIEIVSLPSVTCSIGKTIDISNHVLTPMPPVFHDIEGQAFLLEDSTISAGTVYDKSNLVDTVAEFLFEIDLETIPSDRNLCRLAVSILDEEENSYADELCLIISTWNSVQALRKITTGPAQGLEHLGTYKIQDQKTVQLFSILEQDYRRPRLRRFCVFVCKLHRGVRI